MKSVWHHYHAGMLWLLVWYFSRFDNLQYIHCHIHTWPFSTDWPRWLRSFVWAYRMKCASNTLLWRKKLSIDSCRFCVPALFGLFCTPGCTVCAIKTKQKNVFQKSILNSQNTAPCGLAVSYGLPYYHPENISLLNTLMTENALMYNFQWRLRSQVIHNCGLDMEWFYIYSWLSLKQYRYNACCCRVHVEKVGPSSEAVLPGDFKTVMALWAVQFGETCEMLLKWLSLAVSVSGSASSAPTSWPWKILFSTLNTIYTIDPWANYSEISDDKFLQCTVYCKNLVLTCLQLTTLTYGN